MGEMQHYKFAPLMSSFASFQQESLPIFSPCFFFPGGCHVIFKALSQTVSNAVSIIISIYDIWAQRHS